METTSYLLPDPGVSKCEQIEIEADLSLIRLKVTITQESAECPLCKQSSSRVHSDYWRTVADLPWADKAVNIRLHVRRFFCDNSQCKRAIFTERIPTVVAPWARRTQRLAKAQQAIGLVAGGNGGAKLCTALTMPASAALLLALLRKNQPAQPPTPRVLGVDDWAQRKGYSYGTILVDLEKGCVVELLHERNAETLAKWLREHPGVEIVSRDRAEAYAQGAKQGAPQALQVADRFHLLKNLAEAVGKILQQHQPQISKAFKPTPAVTVASTATIPPIGQDTAADAPPSATSASTTTITAENPGWRRRQQRVTQVTHLHKQGWSAKAIAQELGLHPKTVSRYLHSPLQLPSANSRRPRLLDPYLPYLLERWNAGCYNGAQLLRELQAKGFSGHYSILRTVVRQLRQSSGLPPRVRIGQATPISGNPLQRLPTPRSLTWLVIRDPQQLSEDEKVILDKLRTLHPHLETSLTLAQAFAAMIRQRQHEKLDGWLSKATDSGLTIWRSFVQGIQQDLAAVRAALETAWSNGPTEGHVNRLKCLKRQMYGRAKLDLLRLRLLSP